MQARRLGIQDAAGNTISTRVSQIHRTGGRLLDAHYDAFVMRVRLADGPGEENAGAAGSGVTR